MKGKIKLGKKQMGPEDLYFIADIGANHDGSLEKAIELINLAKESGADAAKFQNFIANKIVSKYEFDKLKSQLSHQANWKKSVFEVYEDASIDMQWTNRLKLECEKVGIDYFTSPYDFDSVDFVDPYVELYKIGSGDISWIEIIKHIVKKGKPTLIATGASDLDDVKRVMDTCLPLNSDIVLMQCNTNYTGNNDNFNHCNLNVLKIYEEMYPEITLGLSDHTFGHSTVLGSLALGARVIEKHFTDNNQNDGPDHFFAMNPKTWREMVDRSYELISSLGDGKKRIEQNEKQSYYVQRRSICASKELKSGYILTKDDLTPLRPYKSGAYHPYQINELIGKKINKDLKIGESIINNFIS